MRTSVFLFFFGSCVQEEGVMPFAMWMFQMPNITWGKKKKNKQTNVVQVWTSAWILIWRQWSWRWEGKTLSHLTISVFVATISDTTFSLTVWISTLFSLMILLAWRSRNPLLVCPYLLETILWRRGRCNVVCTCWISSWAAHHVNLEFILSLSKKISPVLSPMCVWFGLQCCSMCWSVSNAVLVFLMWFRESSGERTRPRSWQRTRTRTVVSQWA